MKLFMYKFCKSALIIVLAASTLVACNKKLPAGEAIIIPPATTSISDVVNADANLSILRAAITKAGTAAATTNFPVSLPNLFSDKSGAYTFFAPTNAAFQKIGITSDAALVGFRPGQLDTLLRYYVIGGQKLTSAVIPDSFTNAKNRVPNLQEPSLLVLQGPSAALPPGFRMPIFPSKRGNSLWVNTITISQPDVNAGNSVIHKIDSIALPPQQTIKGILASDPNFSLFMAAVARADSGQVAGLGRLDSAMNFALANLTLFAPTNAAIRALFPPGTPDAAIIGALNTHALFPVQTVRGIVAYHLLGYRYFSVNFPAALTPINTQLVIPPTNIVVPVIVSYSPAAFIVKGLANATPSNVTTKDRVAINGVIHVIDQLLRPQ